MRVIDRLKFEKGPIAYYPHPFKPSECVEFVRLVIAGDEWSGVNDVVIAEVPFRNPLTDSEYHFACQMLAVDLAERLMKLTPGHKETK